MVDHTVKRYGILMKYFVSTEILGTCQWVNESPTIGKKSDDKDQ